MTLLGKVVITCGIVIFTVGSLLWIIKEDWHWFAAGGAIFVGSAFTALILSVETKNVSSPQPPTLYNTNPLHATQDDWQHPSTPPPDETKRAGVVAEDVAVDPFYGRRDPNGGTPI